MEFGPLEKTLGHSFRDKNVLMEALTHRSYLNERPLWTVPHNERLEFLGDAVLELVVTEELFNRFPDRPEGPLTSLRAALVNYVMLARVAREAGLEDYILLSKGEARDIGRARDVILANAIEAVIGALYLDGGYGAAKKFVNARVLTKLDEVIRQGLDKDAKSELQERAQAEWKVTPEYRIIAERGPDHQKEFTAAVFFGAERMGEGGGASKQDAEVEAAKNALEKIKTKISN